MTNQFIIKLREVMKERDVKVPALSLATGIPQDRIYKWFKQGTNPKAGDTQTLNDWIKDENYSIKGKTAPDVMVTQENTVYIIELKEQIKELKEDKAFIKKQYEERLQSLESNLEKVLNNQDELTMQIRAGLTYLAEHFAGDDPSKKAKEKEHIDKLISAGRK